MLQMINFCFFPLLCSTVIKVYSVCQLGAKLFAEESFLLGIDWSLTSRCNVSSAQFLFLFLFFLLSID